MGLLIDVYRSSGVDCSAGGVSAEAKRLCVVNVGGPFDPTDDVPAVAIMPGPLGDPTVFAVEQIDGAWVKVRPAGAVGPMFGGNYAASSDSRWCAAVGFRGAVPIHDRYETVEQYASYD